MPRLVFALTFFLVVPPVLSQPGTTGEFWEAVGLPNGTTGSVIRVDHLPNLAGPPKIAALCWVVDQADGLFEHFLNTPFPPGGVLHQNGLTSFQAQAASKVMPASSAITSIKTSKEATPPLVLTTYPGQPIPTAPASVRRGKVCPPEKSLRIRKTVLCKIQDLVDAVRLADPNQSLAVMVAGGALNSEQLCCLRAILSVLANEGYHLSAMGHENHPANGFPEVERISGLDPFLQTKSGRSNLKRLLRSREELRSNVASLLAVGVMGNSLPQVATLGGTGHNAEIDPDILPEAIARTAPANREQIEKDREDWDRWEAEVTDASGRAEIEKIRKDIDELVGLVVSLGVFL